MADSLTKVDHGLERPTVILDEFELDKYLKMGDPVPPAHSIPLEDIRIVDGEVWRQNAMWDRFERLRNEDPLHWTPEDQVPDFIGPFWSVTR
ncbi:MAG: hypothetical protein RLN72_15905 [Henriciella sp.]